MGTVILVRTPVPAFKLPESYMPYWRNRTRQGHTYWLGIHSAVTTCGSIPDFIGTRYTEWYLSIPRTKIRDGLNRRAFTTRLVACKCWHRLFRCCASSACCD